MAKIFIKNQRINRLGHLEIGKCDTVKLAKNLVLLYMYLMKNIYQKKLSRIFKLS